MSVNLFSNIEETSEELKNEELENSQGGGFVKECGVYDFTIEKAFVTETKKGGIQLDLHLGGANIFTTKLYPVSCVPVDVKDKTKGTKQVTTYAYKGKVVSLGDYKMLKQLIFVATGEGQELKDIKLEDETITYKAFGKDVTVEAATLVDLIGKDIKAGIRLEELYEYDRETEEDDKTQLKTNDNGDVVYGKTLFSCYDSEGKTPIEKIKDTEAEQIVKDTEFLTGAKGIKRLTLEASEVETEVEDDIEF